LSGDPAAGATVTVLPDGAVLRPAQPHDVPQLLERIRDLARYEREPDAVRTSAEELRAALFGPAPALFAHVVEREAAVQGAAIWFLNYSTWTGRHGIYLEDLFVVPAARGAGYGRALLRELARICLARGYTRLDWSVLDWNEPSIGFYRSLGAEQMAGWLPYRLSGPALEALAQG